MTYPAFPTDKRTLVDPLVLTAYWIQTNDSKFLNLVISTECFIFKYLKAITFSYNYGIFSVTPYNSENQDISSSLIPKVLDVRC